MLLSFGITSINASNEILNSKTESPINNQYSYVKQDGYIDLGYDNEYLINKSLVLPRSSVNMVNFDMDSRSQSFESFNPNSYNRRNGSATLTTSSMVNVDEFLPTVHSSIVNGEECLYTEGYLPNMESNPAVSIESPDSNDNREQVTNPKIKPNLATAKTVAKYYNIKNNVDGHYYTIISNGTGFLEGPNLMVTAAHCTYGDVTIKKLR